MSSGKISVVSSFSDDIIIDEKGVLIGVEPGGPALFISNVLESENVDFDIHTGDKVIVEIKVMHGNEFGKLDTQPNTRSVEDLSLNQWTLISTISNEWDIKKIKQLDRLFIDAQGFVREGKHFGKKKKWPEINEIADKIYGLKGTAEEIASLPADFVKAQKNKLLVITHGPKGAEVYDKGKVYKVEAEHIDNLKDTIGAGDTFFTFFVIGLYNGFNSIEAAENAAKQTNNFLRRKNVSRK